MARKEFPLKIWVIVLLLVLWNALFLWDIFQEGVYEAEFGQITLVASIIIDAFLILTLIWKRFQNFIMRKGHHFGDIRFYFAVISLVLSLFILVIIFKIY